MTTQSAQISIAIGRIIENKKICKGFIFDTHFIISQLIKKHSDVYLAFASTINPRTKRTALVHGGISQAIAAFEGTLVRQLKDKSWSETIHGNGGECACWQKL